MTETKKAFYEKKISDSNNKIKTIWDIVKSESGRKNNKKDIIMVKVNGKLTDDPKIISNSFNTYFLTKADNIIDETQNMNNSDMKEDYPLKYLTDIYIYTKPFPNIKYSNTTTHEISKTIKSLKSTNSHGYDEILVKHLKPSSEYNY
jgi:hypothetical protein